MVNASFWRCECQNDAFTLWDSGPNFETTRSENFSQILTVRGYLRVVDLWAVVRRR